jgi:hypothetical protein
MSWFVIRRYVILGAATGIPPPTFPLWLERKRPHPLGRFRSLATQHRDQCQDTASRFVEAVPSYQLDWVVQGYSKRSHWHSYESLSENISEDYKVFGA